MDAPSYGKLFIVAVLVQLAHAHLNNGVAQVGARGELHSSGLVKPKTETTPNLRRSTLETTPPANFVDIQRRWHNWYACTDSTGNGTFENRQYFAPPNYFFLAFGTTCEVTEKNGTISTGNQTLVFNLDSRRFVSYANDWIVGNCSATTSAEAEKLRFDDAAASDAEFTSPAFKSNLFSKVDGKDLDYFYIYDNGTFFFEDCPGKEICGPDPCDDPQSTPCKGVDAFPLLGWYAAETRNWSNGETHTYEMGNSDPNATFCSNTRYVITAVAPPTKAPTKPPTKAPTKTPTGAPTTKAPNKAPTKSPTEAPTKAPSKSPTKVPTKPLTKSPTKAPTKTPAIAPMKADTTKTPTKAPTKSATTAPTKVPIKVPTKEPVKPPTTKPTQLPTSPPRKSCGLFLLRIFCPLTRCGLLGRTFGWCK